MLLILSHDSKLEQSQYGGNTSSILNRESSTTSEVLRGIYITSLLLEWQDGTLKDEICPNGCVFKETWHS
eukprot:5476765-Ditylum_brightwellii.AAC.1